ncbi:MAG: hypothetical protein COB60_06615 [Flavobacteriaceae bacterium]|nr:MAG: hypothetical protein COB60_06615 [Flavobacteriaceae bacterium]
MKNLILLFSIILSFNSCSQNEEEKNSDNSIVGTWKLIEVYSSDGGSNPQWKLVENGYIYTFKIDGTFTSNRFSECSIGKFELNNSNLTLRFDCNGFTTGIESPEGTFIENFNKKNNEIILKPTYLNCIEGCGNKFQKIKN